MQDNKTLVLFATYKITAGIMSEFKKMQNCGVECVLGINNTYQAVEDDKSGAVQIKTLFGVEAKCLLLYQKDLEDLGLHIEIDIGYTLWHSSDYWVYVARKYFKDFDFYWQIDYDCFLNAKNYQNFFDFYKKEATDFIVSHFRKENRDTQWVWVPNTSWAYDESVQWYGSLFSIARYSKNLADLLYQKRVEYKKIYENFKGKKQWLVCEFFTATEAMKNGFSVRSFTDDGHQIRIAQFDLNVERIFNTPDDKMYHPVKENFQEILNNKELNNKKILQEYEERLEKTNIELCQNHIKSYLCYKLGLIMIHYNENFLSRIKMPYLLLVASLNHKAEQKTKNLHSKSKSELLQKYKNHKKVIELKEHLSYKLGEALIKAYKNKWGGGLLKFLFVDVRRIKREFKQKKKRVQ